MTDWKKIVVATDTPLAEAIDKITTAGTQLALVLDGDGRLIGVLTDGDIRRALLRGQWLTTPVAEVMNPQPTMASVDTPRDEILSLMRRHVFHHLPLVDENHRVVGLATLDELIGAVERPNWVVLMAGGLGTRLRPLTEDCPKPLLSVGGKPILESILDNFIEQGFRRFFLSVNYKAEMIRTHFGEGDRWGVQIEYLHENTRLGTAGALSLLSQTPGSPLIVMNGDLLTRANFADLLKFHGEHGAAATMAVREYDFQVPYGVVRIDGAHISAIEEKPVQRFYVNAGIYILSPTTLEHIPANTFFDMPTLFEKLIAAKQPVAAYHLREYWLDIGRLEEFDRAQQEWPCGAPE